MRIESLTVALRPRTAWEAVELGTALLRRHAGAVWAPWLWLTLPAFALVNALAWSIDALWLAALVMWWLKPVFDRVPLYVLSRAVFGDVPGTRATLRAQLAFGRRWLPAYLLWRRFGPVRAVYLPVDLLEGGTGADARRRRGTLGAPVYGVAALLLLVCLHFELVVMLGLGLVGFVFIPDDYLIDTARTLGQQLLAQPAWIQLALNALAWAATAVIEPFYVAAGFGLYLNRRTEIEGWDIELALRRLRARLLDGARAALLAAACAGALLLAAPVRAQDGPGPVTPAPVIEDEEIEDESSDEDADIAATPDDVFGPERAPVNDFRRAVAEAYADPSLSPKRKVVQWKPRDRAKRDQRKRDLDLPPWLQGFGRGVAAVGEYGLWALMAALVLVLVLTARRWWPWLRGAVAAEQVEPTALRREAVPAAEPLPDDIASAARRLWAQGHRRDALALLYRASVAAMVERAQVTLVPGATEAECLRAARRMPLAADRDAFARVLRDWQYAAYAHQLPDDDGFDALLGELGQRFGWAR